MQYMNSYYIFSCLYYDFLVLIAGEISKFIALPLPVVASPRAASRIRT